MAIYYNGHKQATVGGGLPIMPWVYGVTKLTWDYNPMNYLNHIKGVMESGDENKGLILDLKPFNLEIGKSYTFTCGFIGNTKTGSSTNYACNIKYTDNSPAIEEYNTGNYIQLQTETSDPQSVTLTFTAATNNYIIFNGRKFSGGGGYRINSFNIEETQV